MVAKSTDKIEMWITDYCHEMDNHGKILKFLRGIALRPYIDRLNEEEQKSFMDEVMSNLEIEYHYQANGKILFPFKRLFLGVIAEGILWRLFIKIGRKIVI